MKSMFQIIAAVACALALTACGGGSDSNSPTTPAVVQPVFSTSDKVSGTGQTAATGDLVAVHYVGWLYDASKADKKGEKIDSSIDINRPLAFTLGVGKVVPGWDQGIVGMQEGGTRTLILPASMGFGSTAKEATAAVGSITYAPVPANSPLIFEVQLLSVKKATVPVVIPPPTVLEIKDTVTGTGTEATAGKTVTVHYTGWVYNGSAYNLKGLQFDSDADRGVAFEFTLGANNVIKGWEQGVLGMKIGGRRTLTIPPELAYGVNGKAPSIPGGATLIFEIELLTVK